MPFMQGRAALGRTLDYLQKGQIVLKNNIRILMFAFNIDGPRLKFPHHAGLRNFVLWHVPQLQYMNPNIQILTIDRMSPNPWIQVFYEDEKTRMVIDCDSRSREEIHEHIKKILGKTDTLLKEEGQQQTMLAHNPANFGAAFDRHCICEVPGQLACPAWQPLPEELRGKTKRRLMEQAKEEAAAKAQS